MDSRVSALIRNLGLEAHPEGGCYSQVFRSPIPVQPSDGRNERPAVTSIYFLLQEGERSRWHQVLSDELWHYYEGDPLELYSIDPKTWKTDRLLLGREDSRAHPVQIIPAGHWQAARTAGEYTLVGCTVAPGFEYQDFRIFEVGSPEAEEIKRRFPHLTAFL
jgi:predicted cupin superfamily sugar epimerase